MSASDANLAARFCNRAENLLRRKVGPFSISFWLVVVLSTAYSALFGWITIEKYLTYNATFLDLGNANEVYWLTLHGTYAQSGYGSVYPYPFESLGYLFLLPFYALYPSPETLLAAQSVTIGFAAVPLYLVAIRLTRSTVASLVLCVAFLAYFPLEGGNLFDFHWESIFPLFFFVAAYGWVRGNPLLLYVGGLGAGLVDLLALLEMIVFVFVISWIDISTQTPKWPIGGFLRRYFGVFIDKRLSYGPLLGVLSAVAVWLLLLHPETVGGTASTLSLSTSNLFSGLDSKFAFWLLLLAPIGFLPLVDLDPLVVVLAPFLGLTFFADSAGSAVYTTFYRQYPMLAAPILFVSTARAISHYVGKSATDVSTQRIEPSDAPRQFRRSRARPVFSTEFLRTLTLIVVLTAVFSAVYSPVSPINELVPGTVIDGSYQVSTDLQHTQHDAYLWQILGLIPSDASVLTQNSIPQVSGRAYVEVAGYPLIPGLVPEYILGDSNAGRSTIAPWSGWPVLLPYVKDALTNGTYGVVAYADGIILLGLDHFSAPLLFVPPPPTVFSANQLTVSSGELSANGTELTHPKAYGNNSTFWYGPYASLLLPGTYLATFNLSLTDIASRSANLLTLDVTAQGGTSVLAKAVLNTSSFNGTGWTQFALQFKVLAPISGLEYRGIDVTDEGTVSLSNITVRLLNPQ